MYFLDTNICICLMKKTHPIFAQRLLKIPPNQIFIPSIVKAELFFGAYKSNLIDANIKKINIFLKPFMVKAFDENMADIYGQFRAQTQRNSKNVGSNELFIASIAAYYDGILITNNFHEFSHIQGLKLENWI